MISAQTRSGLPSFQLWVSYCSQPASLLAACCAVCSATCAMHKTHCALPFQPVHSCVEQRLPIFLVLKNWFFTSPSPIEKWGVAKRVLCLFSKIEMVNEISYSRLERLIAFSKFLIINSIGSDICAGGSMKIMPRMIQPTVQPRQYNVATDAMCVQPHLCVRPH